MQNHFPVRNRCGFIWDDFYILMINNMTEDALWFGSVYSLHILHTNGAWLWQTSDFFPSSQQRGRGEIIFILCIKNVESALT